ncbi:MAG: DUF4886 domain-containing protein [Lentisphaerae bacterium]|jgi:hypothetical protein|nr:DUF4886 domain-containing protein [Lentisphaerota bacterium]
MKNRIFFLLLFFVSVCSLSAKALKVLTIGNSFADSVFAYLPAIAKSAGDDLVLDRANIGGCSLQRHMDELAKSEKDPSHKPYAKKYTLFEKLTAQQWDIVTIQQVSTLSWKPESFHPHIDGLVAYIRKHAPQAEIVIQQTWAYRLDAPRFKEWQIDQQEMFKRLTANYEREAKHFKFRMIPTGYAVQLARDTQPVKYTAPSKEELAELKEPNLPNQDGSLIAGYRWSKDRKTGVAKLGMDTTHLNNRGRYLQACVWYAFLFGKDANEINFLPVGIDEKDAAFLRSVAQKTVEQYK